MLLAGALNIPVKKRNISIFTRSLTIQKHFKGAFLSYLLPPSSLTRTQHGKQYGVVSPCWNVSVCLWRLTEWGIFAGRHMRCSAFLRIPS